jgi:DNA polymerase-4
MQAETTCVIAASYEAKKYGVKTGTIVRDARLMCPGLVLVSGNHLRYVEYHKKIIDAVESCHPVTAVCSIDEVACALGGRDQKPAGAVELAKEIKEAIYKKVGESFGCSIGIAPNRFLAKVASDMQKPNGLTLILPEDIPEKLYRLELRDMIGIGANMEVRLNRAGVYTMRRLYELSIPEMRHIWGGINGERFYHWIRGANLEVEFTSNQSVGHQHVLPPDRRSLRGAYQVGLRLLNKAGVRLRKLGAWTRHMSVSVKFMDRTYWGQDVRMIECQDTQTLQDIFDQMWSDKTLQRKGGTPIKVSVTLGDFIHESERTFSFFENKKRVALSQTVDTINERYGRHSLHFGSVHEAMDAAPTRIAFTSIPDEEL